MAHEHPIYDTDPHFKIDGDTRIIINASDVKVALMQGDHNSERFTFEIPRYVDGHDMSLCNICQIHYLNVASSTRATNSGIYEVEDLQFDPKDEQNRVVLSWLISSNVTMYVGSLSFVIRFGCSTDGVVDYIWNTAVHSGITISSSICNSETVVQDYTDILEQWRDKLFSTYESIIDKTLTKSGQAADAKVTGDSVTALKEDISELSTSVFEVKESPNIFDKTKINQDKGLVTWGTPTMSNYTYDKTGWATSYPIAVRGGSTIHVYKFENGGIKDQDVANLVTFAKDGSFIAIEGQNKNEIKLSENTAYIIFDINNLTFIDSLMLTTEPYNGVHQEYGRKKVDKVAKIADDVSKINSDKTHIIFSFDAFKIDNRFELMKSYGFPFTIAIAQTILTYPISKDDYYNYFVDGNVDFSVYAGKGDRPGDYRSDKDKWSAWVKELVDGLKETSGLYYPVMYSCQNAASSDILNQVVKENGFRMCRNGTYYNADGTTTYGILTNRKYLIDGTKYFDYYPLSVVKQEGYPTVEQIKAEIDNAIEKKKSIMLFTHYVVDDTKTMSDTDCPLSKFTAVLDYVKEKVDAGLCDVKNARQFWNYYNQQDGLDRDYKRTNMRDLFDTTH